MGGLSLVNTLKANAKLMNDKITNKINVIRKSTFWHQGWSRAALKHLWTGADDSKGNYIASKKEDISYKRAIASEKRLINEILNFESKLGKL